MVDPLFQAQDKPLDATLTGDSMKKAISFIFLDGAANNNLVAGLTRAMKPGDVGQNEQRLNESDCGFCQA